MSRVLIVVPPLTGHVNPAVAVAGELAARGHTVAIAGHAATVGPLLPAGLRLFALDGSMDEAWRAGLEAKSRAVRGPASLKFLWEDFLLPLGASMAPAVSAIVDEFAPDALVADQQALGAAVVARRRGLPWATLATTSAEFDHPYHVWAGVGQWVTERLRDFQVSQGLSAAEAAATDPRFSEHLTLVCSVPELLLPAEFPDHYVFVGSMVGWRRPAPDFPWDWFDHARPTALVTLGTVTREAGGRFLSAAAEALSSMGGTAGIVVAPPGLLPGHGPAGDGPAGVRGTGEINNHTKNTGRVGSVGDGAEAAMTGAGEILVRPYVPQLELMPYLSAVVCHAGNNTVCEALSHGIPLVVAPVRDDQPVIADQVVRSGAGLRVRFGRAGPPALQDAVRTVLTDPSYRSAAGRYQSLFAAAGGAATAADHVEKLAA